MRGFSFFTSPGVIRFGCSFILGMMVNSAAAAAIVNLKQIEVRSGTEFQLLLDGRISNDRIAVEYLNDIIQVSLNEASIYPAKIIPVRGSSIFTKIFAYQYTPRLVRCRFSVKGKAEDFKGRFRVTPFGKTLKIEMNRAPSGVRKAENPAHSESSEATIPQSGFVSPSENLDEKILLKKVMESTEGRPENKPDSKLEGRPESKPEDSSAIEKKTDFEKRSLEKSHSDQPSLNSGKPLTSLWKVFLKLLGVLTLLGVGVIAIRKLQLFARSSSLGQSHGFGGPGNHAQGFLAKGFLGRLARFAKGGMGGPEKMIEVVSTHYLDPKKYIALVKVKGRLLVLGISNDSISLITRVGDQGGSPEDDLEPEADSFSDFLDFEKKGEGKASEGGRFHASSGASPGANLDANLDANSNAKILAEAAISANMRSRVRSKLEGLKPL